MLGAVAVVAATVALLRTAWLDLPVALDEAGFLVVGGAWSQPVPAGTPEGSTIYGAYWLDRPPGLVAIFQAAAATGADAQVRAVHVIGVVAATALVLAVAYAAHQLLRDSPGRRAGAVVAAVAAGVWVSSPLMGTAVVNGELLAAPWTALGLGLLATAVSARVAGRRRPSWAYAAAAGAAGAAAASVKQNMVDVFVAAVVLLLAYALLRRLRTRSALGLAVAGGAGALAAVAAVTGWALLQGTTVDGVWYATYGFRIDALVEVPAGRAAADRARAVELAYAAARSGLPLVLLVLAWRIFGRRRDPWGWTLGAVGAYALASIVLGGSFWDHYLVQLVVPAALGLGWIVGTWPTPAGAATRSRAPVGLVPVAALGLVAVVAAPAWQSVADTDSAAPGQVVGRAVAAVAAPTDTLVSTVRDPAIQLGAGLDSPYPYLWALPAFVLDPGAEQLQDLVADGVPTWVVTGPPTSGATDEVATALRAGYRVVARACGGRIWLRTDVVRAAPASGCPTRRPPDPVRPLGG